MASRTSPWGSADRKWCASSLLAIAYVWRFVEVAYLREPPPGRAVASEAPWSLRIPAYALVAATIWFGLDTSLTVGSASAAAAALLGSAK